MVTGCEVSCINEEMFSVGSLTNYGAFGERLIWTLDLMKRKDYGADNCTHSSTYF